jgi:hypothetical protein
MTDLETLKKTAIKKIKEHGCAFSSDDRERCAYGLVMNDKATAEAVFSYLKALAETPAYDIVKKNYPLGRLNISPTTQSGAGKGLCYIEIDPRGFLDTGVFYAFFNDGRSNPASAIPLAKMHFERWKPGREFPAKSQTPDKAVDELVNFGLLEFLKESGLPVDLSAPKPFWQTCEEVVANHRSEIELLKKASKPLEKDPFAPHPWTSAR